MLVDLPVAALYTWQGRNPCPGDHGVYWERALEELRAVDPRPELVPSKFTSSYAECFDLYYTGVRGARIHAKYVRPRGLSKPAPALCKFHGYSGSAGAWFDLLPYAAEGIAVAAMDCRGQGGTSEDPGGVSGNTLHGHIIRGLDDHPDNLLFRHIYLDTAELADILASFPEIDPNRMGAFGGSQGGGLTVACAALSPRIKRAVSVHPFLCDYQRVWETDLAKAAYQELTDYFRRFDPRHEREKEVFTKLGYIDLQFLAPRIKGEVLLMTGLMDTVCPPSSQFAMYNKISSPKKALLYPDFGHESLPDSGDITFEFMSKL
jgi:cephalosporin-C deacetylase